MVHLRNRFALQSLFKKLKFARVVSLQGARQTGKSTLARDLLPQQIKSTEYVTFDQTSDRQLALLQPDSFLESKKEAFPLVIDEAQKVPSIFDAVKLKVDQDPRPGQFLLLGSTEFSKEIQIKESLTGRLSRIRIYPLTPSETLGLEFKESFLMAEKRKHDLRVQRKDFFRYLENGGFPGVFAVRSESEKKNLLTDWISLVSGRDLMQFRNFKVDPDLARSILEVLPKLDVPDLNSLSKKLRFNGKKIKTHLDLLEQLFAVHSIQRHPLSAGKKLYFLCDVGLVHHLGGDLRRKLETWIYLEIQAQLSYSMALNTSIHFYRSSRGGRIDLIIENEKEIFAIRLIETEKLDLRELEILKAFHKKMTPQTSKKINLIALGPYLKPSKFEEIELLPWEVMI